MATDGRAQGGLRGLLAGLEAGLFGREKRGEVPAGASARLAEAVRLSLPEADEDTRAIVTATAGLLACVAYADRDFSDAEEREVHEVLGRIHGLHLRGVEAICGVLREEIVALGSAGDQVWARVLRERGDRALRCEVLEVLVDIAAADGELSLAETNYLRRLAPSLGLIQADYDAAQERHKDKLTVLR